VSHAQLGRPRVAPPTRIRCRTPRARTSRPMSAPAGAVGSSWMAIVAGPGLTACGAPGARRGGRQDPLAGGARDPGGISSSRSTRSAARTGPVPSEVAGLFSLLDRRSARDARARAAGRPRPGGGTPGRGSRRCPGLHHGGARRPRAGRAWSSTSPSTMRPDEIVDAVRAIVAAGTSGGRDRERRSRPASIPAACPTPTRDPHRGEQRLSTS